MIYNVFVSVIYLIKRDFMIKTNSAEFRVIQLMYVKPPSLLCMPNNWTFFFNFVISANQEKEVQPIVNHYTPICFSKAESL